MLLKRRIAAGALAIAIAALGLTACSSGPSQGDGKTLTVWNYEDPSSAMGQAWAKAVQVFKKEHPGVTVKFTKQAFTSTKNNAKVLLSGNNVADVMEYNKGAADTGQLASLGLLTPLTDEVKKRGWDKTLSTDSLQLLSKYDENGVPGKGDWYGVPNYGEYILWYYNKDYFTKNGLTVPTTRAGLDSLLAKIKSEGVTPISASAKEFPEIHSWFEYVLRDAPADWVDNYQLFKGKVDWTAPYWVDGTQAAQDLITKGYVANNITGVTHEQMGVNFISQKNPLMMSGSWWYGRLAKEAKFDWGTFAAPEQNLNEGSVGNLWVVPAHAKNKELAYDFIDITLRPEIQNILGEQGGLPVAGDPSAIKDKRTQDFTATFQDFANANKLALYPDFPIPGYFDYMLSESQSLANKSKTPEQIISDIQKYYEKGRAEIEAGK